MSTYESWSFTPRQFAFRAQVFLDFKEQELRRWCIERVERLNAPHFNRKDKRAYTLEDFLGGAQVDQGQLQTERDRVDLARELARDKFMSQRMKARDFDDSELPGWARMTPQEKQTRGIQ